DDVASWTGAASLVDQAISGFGKLDILVNNAGILRDRVVVNMTEDDWDSVIRVHLKGHAATTHHAANHWRARSKAGETVAGRIVNTASESGFIGMAGQANYAAAKAGIAALTMVAARELKRYGVTANCIAPRARTRLITQTFGDTIMGAPEDPSSFDQFAPENVAPLVAYLASDAASHISGQVFVVFAGSVQHMRPWSAGNTIDKGARWEPSELGAEIEKLFDGGPSALD
ncbi:MAG: SDR family oxidoreductase, partial [Actinomycetota bacterium]